MTDPPAACVCPCHRPGVAMHHARPCCGPCPRCGARIASGVMPRHLAECRDAASDRDEAHEGDAET